MKLTIKFVKKIFIYFFFFFASKRRFDWETQEKSIKIVLKMALPSQNGPKWL